MAGQCVARLPHTCGSTSKPLQVFLNPDNTYSGFCFHCHKVVKDPYGNNPPDPKTIHVKTDEEIQAEIEDIRSCPTVSITHRSIEPEDWKFYGVRLMRSEFDGTTPYAIAHPYTKGGKVCGFKVKLLARKTMWSVGDTRGADLYGWERAKLIGGTTLYITEGEEDAIALRKILRAMSNGEYDYAVVSLPAGTESVDTCLGRMSSEIKTRFKKVVLAFDNDEPGRKAAIAARKVFPDAHIATLPGKDANECLEKGRLKNTRDACVFQLREAKSELPVLKASSIMKDILQEPEWGMLYPWQQLNSLTYGQRKGELVSIGGGTGVGKTLIGHELIAWNGIKHGWKTLAIMLEETPAETFKNVAGKLDDIPYHVPRKEGEEPFDLQRLKFTVREVDKFLTVWDITTIEDAETTWAQIENVIRSLGQEFDVVMIDNATALSEGLNASERNDFIGKVAAEFTKLAHKFDFMAVMFSHLNAPQNGRSHENGGKVLESQFTGSRALQRYSHMMFGFERNKMACDTSCSKIAVLKNRKFGRTGSFKTYYKHETGRLIERDWDDESYEDRS